MKKHPAVEAAEAVAEEKAAELAAARDLVQRLERERSAALMAVRQAQEAVDAELPQCRLVRVHWRSGKETDAGRVVILRRTPGGMLVARRVGDAAGDEIKFKWREHSTKYVEAKKQSLITYDQLELRDVPAAFVGLAKTA